MPQRRNAIKALRINQRRHMMNLDVKTDLKKTIKKFAGTVSAKPEEAKAQLKDLYKKIDKAAKRNVIHKKTAARRKSRYTKLLNQTAAKA